MSRTRDLLISLEVIDYQQETRLFKALVEELRKTMPKGGLAVAKSNLSKIIKKYTGLDVEMAYVEGYGNFFLRDIPIESNISQYHYIQQFGGMAIGKQINELAKLNRALRVSVDLKAGYIKTNFAVPTPSVIGFGEFDGEIAFTPEELAAGLLHEIGHLFVSYEMIGQYISTNIALTTVVDGILATEEDVKRLELYTALDKALDITISDKKALAESRDKNTVVAVILACKATQLQSRMESLHYDATGPEFMADNFASRQGAGLHLVTMLDKVHSAYGYNYKPGARKVVASTLVSTVAACLTLVTSPVSLPILYMLENVYYMPPLYDNYRDRYNRIKRDAIQIIKDPRTPKVVVKKLVDDIEAIDAVVDSVYTVPGFFEWVNAVAGFLIPERRRQNKQKEIQKELEKLANNPLFVKAQIFRHNL